MSTPKFELIPSILNRARAIAEPALVEARLRELSPDLEIASLQQILQTGLEARNETTRASAVTAAGVQQWLKTVEALRTWLSEKGWFIHDPMNCPFISSPDRAISIVVMTGDIETGRIGLVDPTNQAEKGAVVGGFVHANSQLELFNQEAVKLAKDGQSETQVWALLYHYDKKLKEVRFELAYPTAFDGKRITMWGERLIVGSIPNSPEDFVVHNDAPNAPPTVDVEPKTGSY